MCVKQGTGPMADDCQDPMPCLVLCKYSADQKNEAERPAEQPTAEEPEPKE